MFKKISPTLLVELVWNRSAPFRHWNCRALAVPVTLKVIICGSLPQHHVS